MVALGGGIGASLRYLVANIIQKVNYPTFWATAIVNLIGSFLLGLSVHHLADQSILALFVTVGILGAFTTFSTFAFDIVKLFQESKDIKKLVVFSFINLVGGLLFFTLGFVL